MDSTKHPEGYYYFTETFKLVISQLDPKAKNSFLNIFLKVQEVYKKHLESNDPISVYYNFLQYIIEAGELNKSHEHPEISCSKGCGFCCSINVDSFEHEVMYINEIIKEQNIVFDEERLKKQAEAKNWNDLDPKDKKCVFLGDDNTCRIYDYRPLSCRKHFVVSKPELCNSEKYPCGQVANITFNLTECITSALLNCSESGRFPMLLHKLRNK